MINTLCTLAATDLAHRIRTGDVSPTEVLEAHIERIEAVNPVLNAVVFKTYERARTDAKAAEARLASASSSDDLPPFLGVPCTIKELIAVEGLPNTAGVVARKGRLATDDAPQVARLRAAGCVIMGLTNISESGLWLESANRIYGRTNNPWDPRRMAGGSTGGEAAIIAAGGSPIGLGADIGGSIRNPSFFNGICGHKPSGGLLPSVGHWPPAEGLRGRYCVTGPMGRTIGDLVAAMEILSTDLDPHRDPGRGRFRALKGIAPKDVTVHHFSGNGLAPISRDMKEALAKTIEALAAQGFRIKAWKPKNLNRSAEIWGARLAVTGDPPVRELLGDGLPIPLLKEWLRMPFGRSNHQLISLLMATFESVSDLSPARTLKINGIADAMQAEIEAQLGPHGVIVCPVYPRSAPLHGMPLLNPLAFSYCGIFNVLELPATAVPTGFDHRHMPLGVQVAARRHADPLTLWVASHIEKAMGAWQPAPVSP